MRSLTTELILGCMTGAALLICASMPANAIEFGRPAIEDGQLISAYENVGALGYDVDGPMGPEQPRALCSGFVISDRAFVTAAHCIETGEILGAKSWAVTPEAGSPDDPIYMQGVFTGRNFEDFPMRGKAFPAIGVHPHPLYDNSTYENDVAVLEFPAGTFNVEPVRLVRPGLLRWLKRLRILEKLPVGLVGYGSTGFDLKARGFSMPGYRVRGFSSIAEMSHSRLFLGQTPVLDASLLPGDSGSPQFVLGRAVSLSSVPPFGEQRLDTPAVRWFLTPYTSR